jgi:cation diffusion facilitator CzcD-associated flavoprotein CzcO
MEHHDVVIVGAGLSGIGAAYHLQTECPDRTYAIFEARDAIGGTWDLFRYPGIRSDSDMLTLGYRFKPWTQAKAIADGPSILDYVRETADENGIVDKITFGRRVVGARWSTPDARWTLDIEEVATGAVSQVTCNFVHSCTGYYRYDEGYTPDFPGTESFKGDIVHPQFWPEDLDYAGKRVVVIGSGATAVTLVPAMAKTAAHVTMLQRSPSYVIALPGVDPLAKFARRVLPAKAAYTVLRWKNVLLAMLSFQIARHRPRILKGLIRRGVERQLPPGYDVKKHFKPNYNPWDQRLCLVPDGDLFTSIREGNASVVTDTIETFTERGIKLSSGEELEADVVVTATGLNLLPLGGIEVNVDGHDIEFGKTMAYKGMMFSDVPNLAVSIGYTNASWTLKCDLTCEYVCRLLNHMRDHGYAYCVPRRDPSVAAEPLIDFSSGYVQRSIDLFPKQGERTPWRLHQNYARDILLLRYGGIEDEALEFAAA